MDQPRLRPVFQNFIEKASEIIVGKDHQIKLSLCCLLSQGHLLIEDIPGVGKTMLAKCLGKSMGLKFNRIQFTSDLMPADILGVNIYDPKTQRFSFHEGPIFAQMILADELNRASPKTQSALLQVMEEYKVTIEKTDYQIQKPFFVVATQNPREQVGTNPLPDSQIDRFLMKINLGPPDRKYEKEILVGENRWDLLENFGQIMAPKDLLEHQTQASKVRVSVNIADYVEDILTLSRANEKFLDLSPRGGIDLVKASKGWAYLHNRQFVLPEDVQSVAFQVLAHRLFKATGSFSNFEQEFTVEIINKIQVY